jgi:hypothetical protein
VAARPRASSPRGLVAPPTNANRRGWGGAAGAALPWPHPRSGSGAAQNKTSVL